MLLKSLYTHFLVISAFFGLCSPFHASSGSCGWWFRCGQGGDGGVWALQEIVSIWRNSVLRLMVSSSSPWDVLGVVFYVFANAHLDLSLSSLVCSSMCIQIYYVWCLFCISHTVSLFSLSFTPFPSPQQLSAAAHLRFFN